MLKILMVLISLTLAIIQIAIGVLAVPFIFVLLILAGIAEDITRKE